MFENYREMSAEEKARVKAAHRAVRAESPHGDRYRILAWGFLRGIPYRRMERTTRTQVLPDGRVHEHNAPSGAAIAAVLAKHVPELQGELESKWKLREGSLIAAWLKDPSGAIPAPVRVKRPYVREEAAQ